MNLAETFQDADAKLISKVSHFKNKPWDKTRKEKGALSKIDYLLALDKESAISPDDALQAHWGARRDVKRLPG